MKEASPSPALPTRSSYQLDDDEGPQTLGELKQALAPWPRLVADLVADNALPRPVVTDWLTASPERTGPQPRGA